MTKKSTKYATDFLKGKKIYLYHQTDQMFNWPKVSVNFSSTELDST